MATDDLPLVCIDNLEEFKGDDMITLEMKKEEEKVQQESQHEYERQLKEMRAKQFDQEEREKRAKRLHFLVQRASIYSNWLAEKLEARQQEQKEMEAKLKSKKEKAEETVHKKDPEEEVPAMAKRNTRQQGKEVVPVVQKKTRVSGKRKRSKATFGLQTVSGTNHAALPQRTGRQPVLVTGGEMREYQLVGMEWLISLYDNGLNGILADEMGLGKTLQAIAFLAHLREMGTLGPFLIVAPLTTLSNWVSEIERFTPSIPVVLYHGTPTERMYIRNNKLRFDDDTFPITVTSYEICMNDRKYLQQIMWRYIIVDEGHRLKNLNCRLLRELKTYHSANRLLLTGTPLQNNLSELWSLLNFLMPDIFNDLTAFEEWFEFANDLSGFNGETGQAEGSTDQQEQHTGMVNSLHQILKPFLLRRVKTDVALDLPKKREYILYAPLVPKQKELYDAAIKGNLRELITSTLKSEGAPSSNQENEEVNNARAKRRPNTVDYMEQSDREYFKALDQNVPDAIPKDYVQQDSSDVLRVVNGQKLQSMIVQLRKVCNHPDLFNLSSETAELDVVPEGQHFPDIVQWSGKMLLLERLLPALFQKGHKVLLFSQMTRMLDIIADWCAFVKGWRFCRIDGNIKIDDRRNQIHEFNNNPDLGLFLLSTRAGGLGINLTAADTVIIFDSDWNPQADLQAQDRAHRIGQKRPVIVYRLVTAGTVESKIIEKAGEKRKLEKLVIHKGHFKGSKGYYQSNTSTNLAELAHIISDDDTLKVSVSGGLTPEEILSDVDLERIMDRSPEAYEPNATRSLDQGSHFKMVDLNVDGRNDALVGLS